MIRRPIFFGATLLASAFLGAASPVLGQSNRGTVSWSYEVKEIDPDNPLVSANIDISGSIDAAMPGKVRSALAKLRLIEEIEKKDHKNWPDDAFFVNVTVDSPGGLVEAAMEIGRVLRAASSNVMVGKDARCISACVLVLAGGTSRYLGGTVGIHRPYFAIPTSVPTQAAVGAAIARQQQRISNFLAEMNVDPQLAVDMIKTPPEKIRVLTPKEIEGYGLLERDPVAQEYASIKAASKLGLDRAEYMRRRERAKAICPDADISKMSQCDDDVMAGRR